MAAAAGSAVPDGPGHEVPPAKRPRRDTEEPTETTAAPPITVVVNGLAGPRCTVEASTEWTILQVHEAIFDKINVPVDWQSLIKETTKLGWEVTVGSLIHDDLAKLQLTLLVEEVPEPDPRALRTAIEKRNEATALRLLQRHKLPGLNDVDLYWRTVLHWAIEYRLPTVALRILARQDFTQINVRTVVGWTVLHQAAFRDSLPVCRAILGRCDFTELLARNGGRETALEVACRMGHGEVADFLGSAEAAVQISTGDGQKGV